jgi:hypothetical protein
MKFNKYILIILSLAILCSCGSSEQRTDSKFNVSTEESIIQSIKIDQILKPLDIAIGDDYLCILHDETSNEEQIYVYDAENLDFKYKFARKGLGPKETIALDMVKTLRGDTLDIVDQANHKRLTYLLTDNGPSFLEESTILIPNKGPLQELYWVNDSTLIFNTTMGDLITYNTNRDAIIDQINISDNIDCHDDDYKRTISSFHFSVQNNNVIVGMRNFNVMYKIRLNKSCQFDRKDIPNLSSDGLNLDNMYDNVVYYVYINTGSNFILAQYYGLKMKSLQPFPVNLGKRIFRYELILLDSQLKPIKKYCPNVDIVRVFLDEKRQRIYFWDAFDDFTELKYISF